jgi:glucuronate isomerase
MTSLEPFGDLHLLGAASAGGREGASPGADRASQAAFAFRALCRAAEREGLFLQLLSGIEAVPGAGRVQVNDPRRLLPLYRFFREYGCDFELVLGSSLDNLVAVQAATLFRNVHVGGMWWYNFRPSTYRQSMQYRLEGLPPSKSVLVVSDARSIEWCYGKVLLVKRLLAEVLAGQVQGGWLGREDALWVARQWLYEAPAARYAEAEAGDGEGDGAGRGRG